MSRSDHIWDFVDWTATSNLHHQQSQPIHTSFRTMISADLHESIGEISKRSSIVGKMKIDKTSVLESWYSIKLLESVDFQSKIRIAGTLRGKPVAIRLKNVHFRRVFTATYAFFNEDSDLMQHSLLNSLASQSISERINFIVPVNGRHDNFKRFLSNFVTEFCSEDDNISITVVYFPATKSSVIEDDSDIDMRMAPLQSEEISKAKAELESMKPYCRQQQMKFIAIANGRPFSRGLALQIGAERTRHVDSVDELLFFCDVTIDLKRAVASSIRGKTARGQQVFYPIVFIQYNPLHIYGIDEKFEAYDRPVPFSLDEMSGLWSSSSYAALSIYKSDFMATEGFDLSSRGWGIEEEKLVSEPVVLFRLLPENMLGLKTVVIRLKLCMRSP